MEDPVESLWEKPHPEEYPGIDEVLRMIVMSALALKTREFTDNDWSAYAGCESPNPIMCGWGPYEIIIDANVINIVHELDPFGGVCYQLRGIDSANYDTSGQRSLFASY